MPGIGPKWRSFFTDIIMKSMKEVAGRAVMNAKSSSAGKVVSAGSIGLKAQNAFMNQFGLPGKKALGMASEDQLVDVIGHIYKKDPALVKEMVNQTAAARGLDPDKALLAIEGVSAYSATRAGSKGKGWVDPSGGAPPQQPKAKRQRKTAPAIEPAPKAPEVVQPEPKVEPKKENALLNVADAPPTRPPLVTRKTDVLGRGPAGGAIRGKPKTQPTASQGAALRNLLVNKQQLALPAPQAAEAPKPAPAAAKPKPKEIEKAGKEDAKAPEKEHWTRSTLKQLGYGTAGALPFVLLSSMLSGGGGESPETSAALMQMMNRGGGAEEEDDAEMRDLRKKAMRMALMKSMYQG